MRRLRLLALLIPLACAAPGAAPAAAAPPAGPEPTVLGPAPVRAPAAAPAIVNGAQVPIRGVPWQVHLRARGVARFFQCGGSILAPDLIATAAHCVYDADANDGAGGPFPPANVVVQAGVSHVTAPRTGDVRQERAVVGIDPHPYYVYTAAERGVTPNDVALVRLARPLTVGPTATPVALAAGGPLVAPGTVGFISGYGRQVAGGTPDGSLYGVDTAVVDPLLCGGQASALVLCIQSPTGSACEGDSGGPLSIGGQLAGVASFVTRNGPTGECGIGSLNGYVNVAAPEIGDFLRGSPAPPRAPRGGTDVSARGVFQVGQSMTCHPGTWSEAPSFAYAFVDTRDGTPLQQGPSSTYVFGPGDVGRTVACAVTAVTAGGAGIARTQGSPAIAPAPPPPVVARPAPRLRLAVRAGRRAVAPRAKVAFRITVRNRGAAPARRVVVCDAPKRGWAFGRRLPRGARRARGRRVCWRLGTLRAGARRSVKITLRAAVARRARRTLVNVASVRAANAGKRVASARVRVRPRR